MTTVQCRLLEEKGYYFEELGYGASAYKRSKEIKEMDIKPLKYLNGKYLVIGLCNEGRGKGYMHRGYCKQII